MNQGRLIWLANLNNCARSFWFDKRDVCIFPSVRPHACFLSHGCIVLAECSNRKERCDTGRTRKQEPGWDRKNRKQEEAPIRWLLRCTLGFLLLWVIVCRSLIYREFRVSDQSQWKFNLDSSELLQGVKCVKHRCLNWDIFILVQRQCFHLFDFGVLHFFLRFWCLSDHIHESLFVSGFQLGQWQAGLGLAGTLYLPIPNALISLLVATSRQPLGHCWSTVLWPPAHPYFLCLYMQHTVYTEGGQRNRNALH